jgi:hypothetical protein
MIGREVGRAIRDKVSILIISALLLGFGVLDEVGEGETLAVDKSLMLMLRTPGNPAETQSARHGWRKRRATLPLSAASRCWRS